MYINVEQIKELFSDKRTIVRATRNHVCLSGFQQVRIAPAKHSLHTLYLSDNQEELAHYIDQDSLSSLLITANASEAATYLDTHMDDANNYLIIESTTLSEVTERLQSFFDRKCGCGLMADSLISFLFHDTSLQELVEYAAAHILGNPIVVFDTSFNLLASYTDFPDLDSNDHIHTIVANQGFSDVDFASLHHATLHKRIMASEEPFTSYNPEHQVDQMICTISTRRKIGHIIMNASCHPFDESDFDLFYLLKKIIHERLQKSEFIRNNKGYDFEYYLRDLLSQKVTTNKKYKNRLDSFAGEMTGNFQCLVVDGARSEHLIDLKHIRNLFDNRISNTKSLIFGENQLVVVFCLGRKSQLSDADHEMIKTICNAQEIYAGISNPFSDIIELHGYYSQALRSIEMGVTSTSIPGLFRYQDYYMHHMMHLFTQKESAQTFLHPAIHTLAAYDLEHGTCLSQTLAEWLRRERNASATAEFLQVHRNTLINRLRKIDQLVTIDYEDATLRQYLILSYDLLQL